MQKIDRSRSIDKTIEWDIVDIFRLLIMLSNLFNVIYTKLSWNAKLLKEKIKKLTSEPTRVQER